MSAPSPVDVAAHLPRCEDCEHLRQEISDAEAAKVRIEARQARARFTVPLEKYGLQLDAVRIRLARRRKDLVLHIASTHGRVVVNSTP